MLDTAWCLSLGFILFAFLGLFRPLVLGSRLPFSGLSCCTAHCMACVPLPSPHPVAVPASRSPFPPWCLRPWLPVFSCAHVCWFFIQVPHFRGSWPFVVACVRFAYVLALVASTNFCQLAGVVCDLALPLCLSLLPCACLCLTATCSSTLGPVSMGLLPILSFHGPAGLSAHFLGWALPPYS